MDTHITVSVEDGIVDITYEKGKTYKSVSFSTWWIKIPLYVGIIISLVLWIS